MRSGAPCNAFISYQYIDLLNCCYTASLQGVTGVTFAPRQLTSYTTPNFFTGEAALALREANKPRPSSANAPVPGVATAHTPLLQPPQAQGSHAATHTPSKQEGQSPTALPSNSDNTEEPSLKRRAMRRQQPTLKAVEAGLAPALAGHQGQDTDGSGLHRLQDEKKQLHETHATVQSEVSLSAAQPEHMQTRMPVQ